MAQAATAQINARLSRDLKISGDAGLVAAGITPSEAIRALWCLASKFSSEPKKLLASLYPDRAKAENEELDMEVRRKLALVDEGQDLVTNWYASRGIDVTSLSSQPSYEELEADAYFEEYGEFMGWNE